MKTVGKTVIFTELREIVSPDHTALVVWDVQNSLVDRIFNREEFLGNTKTLIAAARRNGIPVAYTKITPLPRGYESSWGIFLMMRRSGIDEPSKLPKFMVPGSREADIFADVTPHDGDLVLNKHSGSIFFGTAFETLMRNRGINTLLFTGISTEFGIDTSARDSSVRGFYTIVVSDCVSSFDKEAHEAALKSMKRICLIAPSTDILKEWQ